MTESTVKKFALKAHKGQKYGKHDYSFHLEAVVKIAKDFDLSKEVIAGCWLHDTIEDCEVSYWEISEEFGEELAKIVYAVTDELGKDRKERKLKTYPKIAANEKALCVKLCDRIANLNQSILDKNAKLVAMYITEYPEFKEQLLNEEHRKETLKLWEFLENLISNFINDQKFAEE